MRIQDSNYKYDLFPVPLNDVALAAHPRNDVKILIMAVDRQVKNFCSLHVFMPKTFISSKKGLFKYQDLVDCFICLKVINHSDPLSKKRFLDASLETTVTRIVQIFRVFE